MNLFPEKCRAPPPVGEGSGVGAYLTRQYRISPIFYIFCLHPSRRAHPSPGKGGLDISACGRRTHPFSAIPELRISQRCGLGNANATKQKFVIFAPFADHFTQNPGCNIHLYT